MKTCDEMVNSLFERRKQYLAEQKRKRRNAVISAALYCCVFAVIGGIALTVKQSASRQTETIVPSSDAAANSFNMTSPLSEGELSDPMSSTAPESFESFDDFEEHEKNAKTNAVSFYYVPASVPSGFELTQIAKRNNVYVSVTYSIPDTALSVYDAQENAGLNSYDASRLQTLICERSLSNDGQSTLETSFIANGYEPIEYKGRTYYRWDEHAENDPEKRVIGYELAFLDDGNLIFLHLPAIDTFENMMKYANVAKVEIEGVPVTSDPATELPIIWAEEKNEDIICTDYYIGWNGKEIHNCLWDAFEENKTDDSCIFAVSAFYFPLDDEFVYKGKTLAQYSEEQQGKRWELLNQLLKEGEALKYGEALYQSGAPDGEKWAKEFYDRTVAKYGDEMLSEYIVDGVFLRDKVLQDIPEAEKEWEAAQPAFMQACAAYHVHVYENTLEQLEEQGIKYELSKYDGRLILFVSREDLDNLTLDNMSKWGFCLASKKTELPIVWYEGFAYDDDIITVFGNKKVNSSLWDLSKEEQNDRLIAIEAEYTSIDKQFVYHGKTLAEYEAEKEAQTRKVDALNILLKDIEFLINNKDSYPSMSPEDKKYYDDTVAKIGEDHISEYIVNGVFQQEKASWDFACAAEDLRTARQLHDKACAAYRAKIYEKTAKQLEAQGIKTAFSRDHDYLLMFISRDDFAKLELDNMSEWIFSHASKDTYWEEYVRLGGYTASDLPIE